jgi:MoaA/NifB/PqqE/SkfB family radical SAM enzyme
MQLMNILKYTGPMLKSLLLGKPFLVIANIYPTFRCNLRCTYCNLPNIETPELTTSQWQSVIDQLAALGCRRVAILGGEPLLRPDLREIIEQVRKRRMACVLTSNGVLVPERMNWLRQLNTLVLSLDSTGPENDAIRGAGVSEAVRKAIAEARKTANTSKD